MNLTNGNKFDIEESKKEIKVLLKKYDLYSKSNRLKSFSEEEVKKEFILRLFKALGWAVYSKDEVSAEETISRKKVDYGFRINGIPKFFVEAKSFKSGVEKDEFAFQAIQYAYNKGCEWAILTNFEKIRVFNAQWKEKVATSAQFFSLDCQNFFENFDQLLLLSRESMSQDLIDREAKKWRKKIRKIPIDTQLLSDLTEFRSILSKSIVKRNPDAKLSEEDLDESVQRILDRLLFIRTIEDREFEPPSLRPLIRENQNEKLWQKVVELYRKIDESYDSDLFRPHQCETLAIWDSALESVIRGLYETKDRTVFYNFAAINADVLGNVYEQYLGHILKKTAKTARIRNGTSKRKEQGIYYTPTFIVDYIISNTLGKIAKKADGSYKKIQVVDPACGSGSFLLRAFEYLISLDTEIEHGERVKTELYGKRVLSTEKFNHLRKAIFGVDLDPKAVEIAQLNLLLRAAEKKERLPSLRNNIRLGNSLIDDQTIDKSKFFIWEKEFEEILSNGGFDVVIGNPPYVSSLQLTKLVGTDIKEYWKKKYHSAQGAYDIFVLFFEQSLRICKDDGYLALITPNKYLSSPYGRGLRDLISKNYTLVKIVDLSKVRVFDDPSVYPIITVIQKRKPDKEYTVAIEQIFSQNILEDKKVHRISSKALRILPEYLWGPIITNTMDIIVTIFSKGKILDEVAKVQATTTAAEADEYSNYINEKTGIPIINTGTIDRYRTTYGIINFKNKGESFKTPHLDISEGVSEKRRRLYQTPKIIIAKLALRIEGFFDEEGKYASINTNCIHSPLEGYKLEYLAGIINSKLMSFVYSGLFQGLRMSKGYFQFQAPQLRLLPIVKASSDNQNKLASLVKEVTTLHTRLNEIGLKLTDERQRIEDKINKLDSEIDEFVYKIYGILENEKNVIKASFDNSTIK